MRSVSEGYVLRRLDLLRARVHETIRCRRVDDPDVDDRFRGLYITDEQAERLLDHPSPRVAEIGRASCRERV